MNRTEFLSPSREKMAALGIDRQNFDIFFSSEIDKDTTVQIWSEISQSVSELYQIYNQSAKVDKFDRNFELFESQNGKEKYQELANKINNFSVLRNKNAKGYSLSHDFDYQGQKTRLFISPAGYAIPHDSEENPELLIQLKPKNKCTIL